MEAINSFADPEFKKQILAKEKKNASIVPDNEYEVVEEDTDTKMDMKSLISGAPTLPKTAKNLILDASAIAKNEREQNVVQMQSALNQVFTDYNKKYDLNLELDLTDLSRSLVAVSNPEKRRMLQLYLSEVFSSLKPLIILHMLERLTVCINYLLDPQRLFASDSMTIPDVWVACQQIMNMMEQLNSMKDEIEIKGANVELKKLAEEHSDVDFESEESKEAINSFMKLFNKEAGIK